jgi:CheY-like chemotaxis protein
MKQVLVVDDVPEVRLVLKALLEGPDLGVLEAADGEQALQVLTAGDVDLVITDCQMPRMSGLDLMRKVREQHPALPFIVVSSTAEPEDFQELKPSAIMGKPFHLLELKEAVEEVLVET